MSVLHNLALSTADDIVCVWCIFTAGSMVQYAYFEPISASGAKVCAKWDEPG